MDDCLREGCVLALDEARTATVVTPRDEDLAPQLKRLDVESGDILVLRTRRKLSEAIVEKWQDELLRLCRAHGARDVSVLVLDDCTDLTIERPARHDTRMQHQAGREPPTAMGS